MTVQELIDELNKVDDKSKCVKFYDSFDDMYMDIKDTNEFSDIFEITNNNYGTEKKKYIKRG